MRVFRGINPISIVAAVAPFIVAMAFLGGCAPDGPVFNHRQPTKVIQKWVSLSPSVSEFANLLRPTLVGHTAADDWPIYMAKQRDSIVVNVKPDYEKIAELKPDLIVYDPSLYNASDLEKLKELNIQLYPMGGDTVNEFITNLYLLASMTLSETSVQGYILRIKQSMEAAQGQTHAKLPTAVLVLAQAGSNPLVAGVDSFYADLVRVSGATPVGPKSNNFVVQTPEQLMALNPQLVIVGSKTGDFKEFMKDPRFAGLEAVKNRRLFGIDEELVERRGGRVDVAINNLSDGIRAVSGGL